MLFENVVREDGANARPEDGFNLGITRMQVTAKNQALMRWLKHRGGARHHAC